ncbi:predicted protein [Lichtheimia corymbifera JMRC:FSU:9682]|uniref:Uncharacterized protein n=1 Tax=Lichtheimia corymbifera JMRC:FSU:9682 TaxID=1263082 RepID=A0A068SEI1_9FUNG|nr:predicted protein [Lichtheimia corymbifera JMRC:FSU:9682]
MYYLPQLLSSSKSESLPQRHITRKITCGLSTFSNHWRFMHGYGQYGQGTIVLPNRSTLQPESKTKTNQGLTIQNANTIMECPYHITAVLAIDS